MTGRYYTEAADVLRGAGLTVIEQNNWQTRSRSSGGFAAPPLCVMWHHTASDAPAANQASQMSFSSDARPIANIGIAPNGDVWLLAAGATNTNGRGNSMRFSRGTVPADGMNTRAWGVEIMNNGVGTPYPQPQIDAAFLVSNTMNRLFGNQPTDIGTHSVYSPDRKIDPARAAVVQGAWIPRGFNGASDSWVLEDVTAECARRWAPAPPPPTPIPTTGDDEMIRVDYGIPGTDKWWARMLIGGVGLTWVQGHANDGLDEIVPGHIQVQNDQHMVDLMATFRCVGSPPSTWSGNPALQNAWAASAAKP